MDAYAQLKEAMRRLDLGTSELIDVVEVIGAVRKVLAAGDPSTRLVEQANRIEELEAQVSRLESEVEAFKAMTP